MSLLDAVLPSEPTKKLTMDNPVDTFFDKTASQLVGQPINRVDGSLKVSGQATYSAEFYIEGQAYGVLVGATIAKGKVKYIDSHAVEAIPGIIKVVTDPEIFCVTLSKAGRKKHPLKESLRFFTMVSP